MKKSFCLIFLAVCLVFTCGVGAIDVSEENETASADSGIRIETVSNDPLASEIYALADDVAEWANDYVGSKYFTADSVNFGRAYKVYSELVNDICDLTECSAENIADLMVNADYNWIVYLEYEDHYVSAVIHKGNGVNMDGPLGEIVRGEREGSEDELLTISNLRELEGHYYVSSMGGTGKIEYEEIISDAETEKLEGALIFSGAATFSPAGILINGNDVSLKYYDVDVLNVSVEDKFIPIANACEIQRSLENSGGDVMGASDVNGNGNGNGNGNTSLPVYFYVALSLVIISVGGIAVLFALKKKKQVC